MLGFVRRCARRRRIYIYVCRLGRYPFSPQEPGIIHGHDPKVAQPPFYVPPHEAAPEGEDYPPRPPEFQQAKRAPADRASNGEIEGVVPNMTIHALSVHGVRQKHAQ